MHQVVRNSGCLRQKTRSRACQLPDRRLRFISDCDTSRPSGAAKVERQKCNDMIKVGVVVTVGRVICSTQLILLIGSAINGVLLTLDRLHSRWKNQHAAFGGTAVSP